MSRVCMETEQQLPSCGRCCCLQRPLVSTWNCTDPSCLLLPVVPGDLCKCGPFPVCWAFPPLQPRDLLGFCITDPRPRFLSLSLNWFTLRASLMASGNVWCTSAIYLWKEMHLQQFVYSLSSVSPPSSSCFEEALCPGSKVLVLQWSLSSPSLPHSQSRAHF